MEKLANTIVFDYIGLNKWYGPFLGHHKTDGNWEQPEITGEKCPECNHRLVKRKGKFGEFIACSNFPNCKYKK